MRATELAVMLSAYNSLIPSKHYARVEYERIGIKGMSAEEMGTANKKKLPKRLRKKR